MSSRLRKGRCRHGVEPEAMLDQLDVHSKLEAASLALREGWVTADRP